MAGTSTPPCPGCLGSRDCWICLGTGVADTDRDLGLCHQCGGSRQCQYCLPSDVRRTVDARR